MLADWLAAGNEIYKPYGKNIFVNIYNVCCVINDGNASKKIASQIRNKREKKYPNSTFGQLNVSSLQQLGDNVVMVQDGFPKKDFHHKKTAKEFLVFFIVFGQNIVMVFLKTNVIVQRWSMRLAKSNRSQYFGVPNQKNNVYEHKLKTDDINTTRPSIKHTHNLWLIMKMLKILKISKFWRN